MSRATILSLLYICCSSCGWKPKALSLLIPCRSILYLSLLLAERGLLAGLPVCLLADWPVGKQAGWQDGRQAGWSAGRLAGIHADITTFLNPPIPSFPFFFWAVWASGNDALKAEITTHIPIRLLADCCFHEKAARYVLSYPKPFGLLPESLATGCLSEVG